MATISHKNVTILWRQLEVKQEVLSHLERRMAVAVEVLKGTLQENLDVPVVRNGDKVERSQPGEYPRKDTGDLQESIVTAVANDLDEGVSGYVGTDQDYAVPLELNMDREFLSRVLEENGADIARMLTRKL